MTDANLLKDIFEKLDSLNHPVASQPEADADSHAVNSEGDTTSAQANAYEDGSSQAKQNAQDTSPSQSQNQSKGKSKRNKRDNSLKSAKVNNDDQWKIPKTEKEIQAQLLTLISPEFVNLHPAAPKELAKLPDFPCDGCGLCCVRVDSSPYLAGLESKRKDGICRYFDLKSKKCLIYKHRPLICNVKEGYLALFKDSMSLYDFYATNIKACQELKEAHKQGKLLKIPYQKL